MRTDTREFTITRVFDAPAELVFAAWTEPAHLASWMGPAVFTTPVGDISLDVRPGGRWFAGMVHEETGEVCPIGGEYRVVDPPRKLVFTLGFGTPDTAPVADSVVTIEFAEARAGTEMIFHQIGQVGAEEGRLREQGWQQAFDKLAVAVSVPRA